MPYSGYTMRFLLIRGVNKYVSLPFLIINYE